MDISKAILNRRSVRQYLTDPVNDDNLNAVLDAARWAPSWANTQCWRFVVVRNQEIKERVADSLNKIQLPDRIVDNPGAKSIRTAPVVIAVCAAMQVAGGNPGGNDKGFEYATDKGDWFMFDTALAVQNICLEAFARGLGTVIIGAFDAKKAEAALGVPEGFRTVVLIPLGYPAKDSSAPPRKPASEIVHYEQWNG
jgi:nitroreductase